MFFVGCRDAREWLSRRARGAAVRGRGGVRGYCGGSLFLVCATLTLLVVIPWHFYKLWEAYSARQSVNDKLQALALMASLAA